MHARAILKGLIEDSYEGSKYVFSIQIIRNDGKSAIIGALGEIRGQGGIVAVWHGGVSWILCKRNSLMLRHPIAELNSKTIKRSFPVSYWQRPFPADILLC